MSTKARSGVGSRTWDATQHLSVTDLERMALRLRRHVIEMLARAGSGHPGGSLSAADVIAALFFNQMRHDPARPHWADRDRFILSKGHAVPVLYAALAECGYFPLADLDGLRRLGSTLQGHPSHRDLPVVEASTGSLGQGLSIAIGMALAAKIDRRDYHVYVLMGDGEIQEGQVWEGFMAAAHYRLDNLTVVVDRNRFQLDGRIDEIMGIEPLKEKLTSFGWTTLEIDGHDMHAIVEALAFAREANRQPVAVIARTVKGKGVSFMENDNEFHGRAPTAEQAELALKELE